MKVDTMRKIDYYFGVPLCFLLTFWVQLSRLWNRDSTAQPKRTLFIELSEMGSAILVDPAMRKLHKESGSELFFVIFDQNAVSLHLLDTIPRENVFTLRVNNGLFALAWDSLRFLFWTRQQRIDTVIDLELFSRFTALLTGLSGASRRIGFHAFHNEGLYRGDMLTRKVAYNAHQHIARNFIALVNTAMADQPEMPYSKKPILEQELVLAQAAVSEAQQQTVLGKIRQEYPLLDTQKQRIVLINPNASDLLPQRRWAAESFVSVMQGVLAEHEDVLILITGSPSEREEAQDRCDKVAHERCVNFAGKVKFTELPALYSVSRLMLTNDSGPGHFSAVTPLKTFVIFGPETPHLYGSLGNSTAIYAGLPCSPCVSASNHRKTPCADNVCIQVITPPQVLALLNDELANDKA